MQLNNDENFSSSSSLNDDENKDKGEIKKENRKWFLKGMKDGIPIALGYFAVSFALGIAAKKAGLEAWQAAVMSFTMLASAGEFAVVTCIATCGGYFQVFLTTIVINLRYLLMSASLSQKINPNEKFFHRFLISYSVTDEIFGIASNVKGRLNPFYNYGATFVASPSWTVGTFLGAILGSVLPENLVNALGVALYGMFLAIVIPPAKKDKVLFGVVLSSFVLSFVFTKIPFLCELSSGMKIIVLTIFIASIAALLFPRNEDNSLIKKEKSNLKA